MIKLNNKKQESEGLKPLDPKKYAARKIFRKFEKNEPVTKPVRKPFYTEFPKRAKEVLFNTGLYISNNIGKFVILILVIMIISFVVLIFLQKEINASFIDKDSGEYIHGYVYFDDVFIGDTDGEKFNEFPEEYCSGTHIVRLESENNAFEWQTYSTDCRSERVVFHVERGKAQPSQNIIFKFLDTKGLYLYGKLYFDDVFVQEINESLLPVLREKCKSITKIVLEFDNSSEIWEHNTEFCDSYDKIEFKVSSE